MSYADMLRDLVAKKNEQNNPNKTKSEVDTGKKVKDQVSNHKPTKKSSGRGR